MNLKIRLNDWKRKLLDLGKRNGLINFKLNSKSILKLTQPSIKELWEMVVKEEKELDFPYINEPDDDEGIEEVTQDFQFGEVFTNKKPRDAQRVLRSLRKKYKTISEEQDVNVLYLSFGFLEWTEEVGSKQTLISPLLLVPVSLQWESIKSPMTLKISEDEIVINPTLSYKLSHDFGVSLPEYQDEEFDVIYSKLVDFAEKNKWSLRDDVCLSILSFLKINIYKDLENHKDSILGHPVINALGGNPEALANSMDMQNISDIDNYDHDSVKPNDVFQVVDADSSQQDAVLCASRGVSFVLQGPPGTGKSQTITNIIASKLAEGKKVLFVSEKKAALDVVYKRLKDVGLSDFCLALHSNKANKKELLNQLENVLTLSRNKATISDAAQYKLDKLIENREKLNTYAKEVNEIISPLNKSIFYANGEVSKYSDIEDISFQIPSVRQTSEKQYRDYISVLGDVAGHIGRMNDNCNSNPWRNTTIQVMTNEFLHDFGEQKDKIEEGVTDFSKVIKILTNEDKLKVVENLQGMNKLYQLLEVATKSPVVPIKWFDEKNISILKSFINKESIHCDDYIKILNELMSAVESYKQLNGTCVFEFDTIEKSQDAAKISDDILEVMTNNTCFNAFKNDVSKIGFVAKNESITKEYISINKEITDNYNEDIFSVDTKSIEMRFKYNYTSGLRILKPSYWADKKLIKQLALNPKAKRTNQDIIHLLENIKQRNELFDQIKDQRQQMRSIYPMLYKDLDTDFDLINKELKKFELLSKSLECLSQLKMILSNLEKHESEIIDLIKSRYKGIKTDWNEVQKSLNWVETFKAAIETYNDDIKQNDNFVVRTCTDADYIERLHGILEELSKDIFKYTVSFNWFAEKFENKEEMLDYDFAKFKARLLDCANDFASLENWIDYSSTRKRISELGLVDYLGIIENKPLESIKIIPVFEKRFYRLWLDSVYPEYPAVANFRHVNHESIIKEFGDLDCQQLSIAQARIKARIINSLPPLDTFTSGEVNILKQELAKQRKIMPIRKLFSKIPNLLMTLKPCLMMSPLSVSQFLESDCYQFDTVIFDEASQVKTENAIGAIFRGKQIVIAGDSHQLPPTNFFNVQSVENDFDSEEEEENESIDTSILEEAMFLPSRELLWHYRSRHEHLIAFSNAKIYKNRLVTFPSNTDKIPDWGVEYIFVENGTYDGKGNPRGNPIEAERVAKEVFNHIKKYPNRTLGVITFGVIQELAIESVVNRMRKEYPECEEFFAEDKHEAFFVKSIENVQGDERDTIIFSIGYAKDPTGKMAMRFGPLSMVGGERRLNVAVTRAKYNIKLIGSIKPTDIDTDRVSQEGPKLLRNYIEFAMNGSEVLVSDTEETEQLEFDSPFESSVFTFLESKGYKVATRVGCSGYKIDLAIKHPKVSGVYVLGIECDGATYHSSRTARERDRLRQDVLEMMGWKFYRIWSTDWIKDTVSEKHRLLTAVENAIASFRPEMFEPSSTTKSVKKNEVATEFLAMEDKTAETEVGYVFKEYITYVPSGRIQEYDMQSLAQYVIKTVKIEQPVHFDVVCQRLCGLLGRQKVTSIVQNAVTTAMSYTDKQIGNKDDFLYLMKSPDGYEVRLAGSRQIQYIAIDELAKGMLKVMDSNIGLTKDELLHETSRAFGFNRIGANITERMEKALLFLEISKVIEIKDDKVLRVNGHSSPINLQNPQGKAR